MYRWRCCVLLCIFCFFLGCHGLSCRSEGGYKDADLKKMYNTCLKKQNNSSDNNRQSEDWRDRGQIWNNDRRTGYRDERSDNRMGNRDRNRDENEDRNRMGNREPRDESYDTNDRYNNMDRRDRNNNRNSKDRNNNGYGRDDQSNGQNDRLNGQNDFLQSEEYGIDSSRSNYYNQYNRRNKRERRVEMNSGQRSQYNPNSHKTNGSENSNDSRSFSSNSSKAQDKACALHCLMENLQMTGENGMPDRYLVTHTITKDVRNDDLRDFLQESIEECFQILDNENTEDKCEFSKNVLLCLSEKGRANCDDWKDEFQF